jgi:phage shock protein E
MKFHKKSVSVLLGLLAAGSVLLAACQSVATATPAVSAPAEPKQVQVDGGNYTSVSAQGLHQMLEKKDFLLVNVHTPVEGNLPQTDLAIAYDTIGQHLDQLPADKNAKILLYCRSGRMSAIAAKELVKLGYTQIWELNGGMASWQQAGYPIAQ